ncbi:hypothetical protein FA95DRAFT_1675497 [Auriscalpium vulgare]|uniref:Uncharacterized protein n=1 Tax=Auriscalpium vulgare TaxID=40419 RepID=A0ACB8S6I3_9AGAM|nr:hypothetical protein FA95DRAFT_1675497 [Auriscalpium vulgare]
MYSDFPQDLNAISNPDRDFRFRFSGHSLTSSSSFQWTGECLQGVPRVTSTTSNGGQYMVVEARGETEARATFQIFATDLDALAAQHTPDAIGNMSIYPRDRNGQLFTQIGTFAVMMYEPSPEPKDPHCMPDPRSLWPNSYPNISWSRHHIQDVPFVPSTARTGDSAAILSKLDTQLASRRALDLKSPVWLYPSYQSVLELSIEAFDSTVYDLISETKDTYRTLELARPLLPVDNEEGPPEYAEEYSPDDDVDEEFATDIVGASIAPKPRLYAHTLHLPLVTSTTNGGQYMVVAAGSETRARTTCHKYSAEAAFRSEPVTLLAVWQALNVEGMYGPSSEPEDLHRTPEPRLILPAYNEKSPPEYTEQYPPFQDIEKGFTTNVVEPAKVRSRTHMLRLLWALLLSLLCSSLYVGFRVGAISI